VISTNDTSFFHRRNLPHFDPHDAPYFITFRLTDTLPKEVLFALRAELDHQLQLADKLNGRSAIESREVAHKRYFKQYDAYLDRCEAGPQWLKEGQVAQTVYDHILSLDRSWWKLYCFTIMPNHVHLLFSIAPSVLLSDLMQKIKGGSAFQCNKVLTRSGSFWQNESWDHVLRQGEFGRVLEYLLENPVKAGLVESWSDWPWTYLAPDLLPETVQL
jgi:putative transposase